MRNLPYKTQLGYKPSSTRYEKVTGKSQTIPGECESIKDMFKRLAAGVPPEQRQVHYMDEELDNISHFNRPLTDMTDLDDLKRSNHAKQQHIEKLGADLQKKKEDKIRQDIEDKIRKEVETKPKGGLDASV